MKLVYALLALLSMTIFSPVWSTQLTTLCMITEGGAYGQSPTAILTAMKTDGITAVQCDAFTSPELLIPWLQAARTVGGIKISYQLDLSLLWRVRAENETQLQEAALPAIAQWQTLCTQYSDVVQDGANGKPLIWWYNASQVSANTEQYLRLSGPSLCWYASTPASTEGWDGVWDFMAGSTPVCTTIMPQYTRSGVKVRLAPDGGVRYRHEWNAAISSRVSDILENSWNDTGDGSLIAGNSILEKITQTKSAAWQKEVGQ